MSPGKQAADESGRREGENLTLDGVDSSIYGLQHHLLGKPCRSKNDSPNLIVVPYDAYIPSEDQSSQKGKTLLAAVCVPEEHLLMGKEDLQVKALFAVDPDNLTPIKISSKYALIIYNAVIRGLVGSRSDI